MMRAPRLTFGVVLAALVGCSAGDDQSFVPPPGTTSCPQGKTEYSGTRVDLARGCVLGRELLLCGVDAVHTTDEGCCARDADGAVFVIPAGGCNTSVPSAGLRHCSPAEREQVGAVAVRCPRGD